MITGIHHIQLAMPPGEEDRARAFYVGALGFEEVKKPPHLAKRGGAWFRSGSAKLHLGVESGFRAAKKAHPAFLVEDLQRIADACRAAGYEVVSDEPLPGYDRLYVFDPFGNRIELLKATDSRR